MNDKWTKENVLDALQYIGDNDTMRNYATSNKNQTLQELEISSIAID